MDLWVLIGIGVAAAVFLGSSSIGGNGVIPTGSPSSSSGLTPTSSPGGAVQAIALAIAAAEGFGVPGAIPTLANNPGDLVLGNMGYGTMGTQEITVYATAEDGWNALYGQIQKWINGTSKYYNPSMTWGQIGAIYAGSGTPWAANVAAALGVDPNSTLGDYVSA